MLGRGWNKHAKKGRRLLFLSRRRVSLRSLEIGTPSGDFGDTSLAPGSAGQAHRVFPSFAAPPSSQRRSAPSAAQLPAPLSSQRRPAPSAAQLAGQVCWAGVLGRCAERRRKSGYLLQRSFGGILLRSPLLPAIGYLICGMHPIGLIEFRAGLETSSGNFHLNPLLLPASGLTKF